MTRDNIFCTLAIGEKYRELARFLCRDFAVYGQNIFIVTDDVSDFGSEKNAICVEHKPAKFSFHDKKIALKKALEIAPTAIFVDADTCMHFYSDRRSVALALEHGFAPGILGSMKNPEGLWS